MALTFKEIPDSRSYLGVGMIQSFWAVIPGASDYVNPGGYTIQATQVGMQKYVVAADIVGVTGAAAVGVVFSTTLVQTNPPVPGVTSFKLAGYVTGAAASAVLNELANGFNLSGVIFTLQIYGLGG